MAGRVGELEAAMVVVVRKGLGSRKARAEGMEKPEAAVAAAQTRPTRARRGVLGAVVVCLCVGLYLM